MTPINLPESRSSQKKSLKRSVIKEMILILAFASSLHAVSGHTSSERSSIPGPETLKVSENKRLEASICADSMNRIAVANDRITHIFGDDGTFESQNDEATGQVFLKPTAENGSKNLSLTLITEQGITQDLTLNPTAPSAKTIILNRDTLDEDFESQDSGNRDSGNQNAKHRSFSGITQEINSDLSKTVPTREDSRLLQLLNLLKQAIVGQLPANDGGETPPQKPFREGCALTPFRSWQVGPNDVDAFQVENETETPLEIEEKDFYQPGDLALSFEARDHQKPGAGTPQKNVLAAGAKTILYVVRQGVTRAPREDLP